MLTIGCHLSASDGFLAMGRTALDIGANTFQFFTRNPRGSKAKAIDPDDAASCHRRYGYPTAQAICSRLGSCAQ